VRLVLSPGSSRSIGRGQSHHQVHVSVAHRPVVCQGWTGRCQLCFGERCVACDARLASQAVPWSILQWGA
jgi:hypothetical protein